MKWKDAAVRSPHLAAYRIDPLSILYVRFLRAGTVRVLNGKVTCVENRWDEEEDWEPTPVRLEDISTCSE